MVKHSCCGSENDTSPQDPSNPRCSCNCHDNEIVSEMRKFKDKK